jgi:hypothetical protein
MIGVDMESTHRQTPTSHICTVCGGLAVMEADVFYLCAPDSFRSLGVSPQSDCDFASIADLQSAAVVDLTDVGEVRSTRVADTHVGSPLIRCASEFRHRLTARRTQS